MQKILIILLLNCFCVVAQINDYSAVAQVNDKVDKNDDQLKANCIYYASLIDFAQFRTISLIYERLITAEIPDSLKFCDISIGGGWSNGFPFMNPATNLNLYITFATKGKKKIYTEFGFMRRYYDHDDDYGIASFNRQATDFRSIDEYGSYTNQFYLSLGYKTLPQNKDQSGYTWSISTAIMLDINPYTGNIYFIPFNTDEPLIQFSKTIRRSDYEFASIANPYLGFIIPRFQFGYSW